MARTTTKTLALTAATAASTGWIPTNSRVPDVQISFAVELLSGAALAVQVEGTFQDVLASGSVASTRIYEVASAAATSALGVSLTGNVTALPAAIRLTKPAGGSAANLRFSVLQSGY